MRIGCMDFVTHGVLVPIIQCLAERYPRVRLHVDMLNVSRYEFPELEERKVDLMMARLTLTPGGHLSPTVDLEVLFDDRFCVVAGRASALARRSKIELADLVNERWIMTPADSPPGAAMQNAFTEAGLPPPEFTISTFSVLLRTTIVSSGQYVTALPASVLRLNTDKLCELPIELPMPRWPVAIVTLKNRALNPAATLFIECARAVTKRWADVDPNTKFA